ncbi:MAG: phosphonate ABC transporter substrate-binding protein [Geminicoccaceae bacterium]
MNYALIAGSAVCLGIALTGAALAEGWQDQYKTIRFGILSGENEKDRIARYTPFEKYLEAELGAEVEIFTAGSYDGVIQAIAADQIEFAFFGSSSYAAAYTETDGGVEPLLSRLQEDGSTGYYSVVAVRCDSGYESLDDLEGKVLAFADPDSTSGYAVPYYNLTQDGYDPKSYFSATPFSGAHETGVLGVYNNQYDAAATYITNETNGIPQRMVTKGMIEEGQICWIWQSPEITSGPFTARGNLPEDLKADMKQAVMDVVEKDPTAFEEMTGAEDSTQVGWIEVDHERYQWIVDMREWLKQQRRAG